MPSNGSKTDTCLLACYGARQRAAPRRAWICLHVCFVYTAVLRVRRRNTKEARHCNASSLELFKEHTAPQLHFNAIIILVFLSADTTLTFSAFLASFFSGERKLAAEHSSRVWRLVSSALTAKSKTNVSGETGERFSIFFFFFGSEVSGPLHYSANKGYCGECWIFSRMYVTAILHLHVGFSLL